MKTVMAFACTASFLAGTLSKVDAGEERLKPTNLGPKVNTKADETDPFVTADGLLLLYASNAAGTFDLMFVRRAGTSGKWGSPKPLPDVNTKDADERSPFVFAGGRLFFASNPVPDEKLKDLKNFDIFERAGELALK